MSFDSHKNFALGVVAVVPQPPETGVALTLQAGAGASMPAAAFNAVCWPSGVAPTFTNAEIVRVESVSGDIVMLSARAQEGTSARQIQVGDQFADMATVKTFTDLEEAVTAEITRATGAESTLATAITTGIGAAKGELATEVARAEGAEATNAGAITAEATRAEAAEATKATTSALATETSAREAGDKTERERAEAAEGTKATTASLSTETTRAQAAEAEAVKLTGAQTVAGAKTFSSSPLVPEPTAASNATSKAYVDALATGLKPHEAAKLATVAALPANTYAAGVLTASANGALTVDGVATKLGERILVKNEAAEADNGIYTVTTEGAAGAKYVLTRATDMKEASQVAAALVFVEHGAENENSSWSIVGTGPWTLGTTAIQWTVFSRAGVLVAGTGLTKTGSTLSANYGTTAGTAAQGNDSRITGAATQTALTAEEGARATADSTHAALTTTAHGGVVASTDARLTNARTPTAHASSHAEGGGDPLTVADLPGSVVRGSAAVFNAESEEAAKTAAAASGLPSGTRYVFNVIDSSGTLLDFGAGVI